MPSRISQELPNGRTILIHHAVKKLIRKVIAERKKAYRAPLAERETEAPRRKTRKTS